jgi:hypothetical protein
MLPKKLEGLNCRRLHRTFWEINPGVEKHALRILAGNEPTLLKRMREIEKPTYSPNGMPVGLGSLIVIMYAQPYDVSREKIKVVLKHAPCIRLARTVYAFPHRATLYDKTGELVDASRFKSFITKTHRNVKALPRLVISNPTTVERLVNEVSQRMDKNFVNIHTSCRLLFHKWQNDTPPSDLRVILRRYKQQFSTLKKVAAFYRKWLKLDFSRSLLRTYKALNRVNGLVPPRRK